MMMMMMMMMMMYDIKLVEILGTHRGNICMTVLSSVTKTVKAKVF